MTDIDTPNFAQALAESTDGSFQRAVQTYLQSALSDVHTQLKQGLSPLEFERARKLETAIEKAAAVIRFSSASQQN